jgi:HAD superfamily hydrolase (TIGR01490 family)
MAAAGGRMTLAIFDLDETLIRGDCSSLWSAWMCDVGWVERADFMARNDALMMAYGEGRLAMEDYMQFTLAPLKGRTVASVDAEVKTFIDTVVDTEIDSRIYADARKTIAQHQALGDRLIVISASGAHLVRPIAERLGITEILAIDLASSQQCYTGETEGILTYREGKVARLLQWLRASGQTLAGASFYSDSRNDLPLLSLVERPYAVNADPTLAAHAAEAGWPQLRWQ